MHSQLEAEPPASRHPIRPSMFIRAVFNGYDGKKTWSNASERGRDDHLARPVVITQDDDEDLPAPA